jgi:hypothetical protein
MKIADVLKSGKQEGFLKEVTQAGTSYAIESLLQRLPIVDAQVYQFNEKNPADGWTEGYLHWVPIGFRRGNAGQISLAKKPIAPLAERLVNGMEAIIELARQRELLKSPDAPVPSSPREAIQRYFKLPPLDQLPAAPKEVREDARNLARRLTLQLRWDKKAREFAVLIRDRGIGQAPGRIHQTLLSLGASDKGDKPYLIGVFGQGGSSTYAASKYSWVLSRRAKDLAKSDEDGVGFSIIKHIIPKGRRDHYFAYLAAQPDGRVPYFSTAAADTIGFELGTWFGHMGYDFGQSGAAITRGLYQALNHVLYNPVLPFDTDIAGTEATIYGNGYRLSNLTQDKKDLDKVFESQPIA